MKTNSRLNWVLIILMLSIVLAGCFRGSNRYRWRGYTDIEEEKAGSDSSNASSTPDDIDGDGWSNELKQDGTDNSSSVPIDKDGDDICNSLDLTDSYDLRVIFVVLVVLCLISNLRLWQSSLTEKKFQEGERKGEEVRSEWHLLNSVIFWLGLLFIFILGVDYINNPKYFSEFTSEFVFWMIFIVFSCLTILTRILIVKYKDPILVKEWEFEAHRIKQREIEFEKRKLQEKADAEEREERLRQSRIAEQERVLKRRRSELQSQDHTRT